MRYSITQTISVCLLVSSMLIIAACGGNKQKKTMPESNQAMQSESDTTAAPGAKLNMNIASDKQFRAIPNVGDRMLHEFKEYRPYISIMQFRKEIGKYVDDNQVSAYEDYIYVAIDRNDSDLQTLLQIPGLEEDEAKKLMDGRPYQTNQAFFDALASSINDEQMVVAKRYMKSN